MLLWVLSPERTQNAEVYSSLHRMESTFTFGSMARVIWKIKALSCWPEIKAFSGCSSNSMFTRKQDTVSLSVGLTQAFRQLETDYSLHQGNVSNKL